MKNHGRVYVSEILRGQRVDFESTKTLDDHLEKLDSDDIIYEDEHAIAYVQHDDDAGSTAHWTYKVAIALKGHVPTLLDLDVSDHRATGALLRAVQAVAYKLQLYDKGFEIRADVLPPLQRKGFLEIKLRSGKHKEPHGAAPVAESSSATRAK